MGETGEHDAGWSSVTLLMISCLLLCLLRRRFCNNTSTSCVACENKPLRKRFDLGDIKRSPSAATDTGGTTSVSPEIRGGYSSRRPCAREMRRDCTV